MSGRNQTDEGHPRILDLPYHPAATSLAIETFNLSSLRQRRHPEELTSHQRLDFDLLVRCTDGTGHHEVDFDTVEVAPGRIICVRAGQVQRWVLDRPYEAQLVLTQPLRRRGDRSGGARVIEPNTDLNRDLQQVLDLLARSDRETQLSVRSLEAIRHLLAALLDNDRLPRSDPTHRDEIYDDFERFLTAATPPPRTVQQCAQLLGCSTRTLSRVCQSITGTTPKALLDRAIALEAQRQLSLGDGAIAETAEALGFAERSNFTRFFQRVTGENPSAFVARLAGNDDDSRSGG